MFPEHFAVPGSKKVLINKHTPHEVGMSNRDRSQLKEFLMTGNWKILSNRINGFEFIIMLSIK